MKGLGCALGAIAAPRRQVQGKLRLPAEASRGCLSEPRVFIKKNIDLHCAELMMIRSVKGGRAREGIDDLRACFLACEDCQSSAQVCLLAMV